MFTKSEVKNFKKGFHESRTGRSESAIVGKGLLVGNRKHRRSVFNFYGQHNPNDTIMVVIGTNRFLNYTQIVDGKKIRHSKLLTK